MPDPTPEERANNFVHSVTSAKDVDHAYVVQSSDSRAIVMVQDGNEIVLDNIIETFVPFDAKHEKDTGMTGLHQLIVLFKD